MYATSKRSCFGLERSRRSVCRRDKAVSLQRHFLADLAWGTNPTVSWQIQLWLGIFPVNWRQIPDADLLVKQISSIRDHLNGSYASLLAAMVLDPALQISLNGPANHRRNPNENLARELLELFSLGEGHFSEIDLREAARALSGYRLGEGSKMILDPRRHDSGLKTILGRKADFDAIGLTRLLAEQPFTALHITKRIWNRLVGAPLPAARRDVLLAGWRQSHLSLPWLMDAIHNAPEAIENKKLGLRLADPLEVVVRSLRLLGSRHPDAITIALRGLKAMGQMPFEPPSVKGWPVNLEWLNLRWLQERRRTLQSLLADEEVWATAALPEELSRSLTPIPPLTLTLPAKPTRDNLALLFTDPVWQLA